MSLVVRDAAARDGSDYINGNSHGNGNGNGTYSDDGNESRPDRPSPASFSAPKQQQQSMMERSPNGLADFFSGEVFQIVLHNPTTAHRLFKFSKARMCGENMEFLEKVGRSMAQDQTEADHGARS